MEEVWKDIYFIENGIEWDYRGLYQVSNLGRVKSLNYNHTRKEKILKFGKIKNGYLFVILYKKSSKKQFYIHRLVAHMFCDGYKDGLEINHIDENKENNYDKNLEWCNRNENCNYGNRNKKLSESFKDKSINKGKNHPNLGLLIDRYDLDGNYIDTKYQFEYAQDGFHYSAISRCCKFWKMNCNKNEWYYKYKSKPQKSVANYIFRYHVKED